MDNLNTIDFMVLFSLLAKDAKELDALLKSLIETQAFMSANEIHQRLEHNRTLHNKLLDMMKAQGLKWLDEFKKGD